MTQHSPYVEFDTFDYGEETGELNIRFKGPKPEGLFKSDLLRIVYDTIKPKSVTTEEATDILCSVVLPHAAVQLGSVQVKVPCSEEQELFWPWYVGKLLEIDCKRSSLKIDRSSFGSQPESGVKTREAGGCKSGLFFGGGIESMAALSQLMEQKPVLLSLFGPGWMNNDYAMSSVKAGLENELVSRFGLVMARVWHNLKDIVTEPDRYTNKYITGSFMYYSVVPLARELSLLQIFHSMELEYAQVSESHDRSIHPRFAYLIPRGGLPPLIPMFSSVPKVELFEMLYRTNPELCSYVYSCLKNSPARWCGTCGKCRRLSAFCDAIGIPKSHIGMQEGIKGRPEKGKLSRLYWKNLEDYRRMKRGQDLSAGSFMAPITSFFRRLSSRFR